MTAEFNEVVVIGAGTMGAGIAEVCAKAQIAVTLVDVKPSALARADQQIEKSLARAVHRSKLSTQEAAAAKARIRIRPSDVATAQLNSADLIIEAVFESLALKKELLARAGTLNSRALLGSNTSSLSITEIAAACPEPSRVVGLHFFNPPVVMPLVEIVRAEQTSARALDAAGVLVHLLNKDGIVVSDFPGFATSRLGLILGMEAVRMLEQGVASATDIDRAMELGYRHPMGPLKLTDLVGLDVRLAIADHLTRELGPQFSPPPLLRQKVRAGKLGKKTGEGFYRWSDERPEPI